jgi:hypothetical protein
MVHTLMTCLLAPLFSLNGTASTENIDIWRSKLAAAVECYRMQTTLNGLSASLSVPTGRLQVSQLRT